MAKVRRIDGKVFFLRDAAHFQLEGGSGMPRVRVGIP